MYITTNFEWKSKSCVFIDDDVTLIFMLISMLKKIGKKKIRCVIYKIYDGQFLWNYGIYTRSFDYRISY